MEDELGELLKKKYTSPFRIGYEIIKGTVMPISFRKYQEQIENLEVRDDDILVSSFAKSGTTWTQEMVWLIANDLDYEGAKTALDERCPFMEFGAMLDAHNYIEKYGEMPNCPKYLLDPIGTLDRFQGRRCIKTHLPWHLLPFSIQNQTKEPKIIHVLRNPKDVCVSFHYHTRAVLSLRGNLEDTYRLFIAGRLHYTPYWSNVLSYWERRHLPNVLIITYEEMKADLPTVIRKVAKFLDKELTQEQVDKLAKHLSFEEMRKNKAVNFEATTQFVKSCAKDGYFSDGVFMRSGTVGSYKKDLTDDMVKALDKWTKENTAGTGLNIY